MSWSTVGKILATFAGLWFVMLVMVWLSFMVLDSAADKMIDSAAWKEYPMHDWQSGCTLDKLREACPPCVAVEK